MKACTTLPSMHTLQTEVQHSSLSRHCLPTPNFMCVALCCSVTQVFECAMVSESLPSDSDAHEIRRL